GKYTPPKRRGGRAGDCARGVIAGAIDSRNGSATSAPIPRRNVRRGNDLLPMTILEISSQFASLRLRPVRLAFARAFFSTASPYRARVRSAPFSLRLRPIGLAF